MSLKPCSGQRRERTQKKVEPIHIDNIKGQNRSILNRNHLKLESLNFSNISSSESSNIGLFYISRQHKDSLQR